MGSCLVTAIALDKLPVFIPVKQQAQMPIPSGYHEKIITPKASRSVEALWSFVADHAGAQLVLPDGRCDVILRDTIRGVADPVPIITGPATTAYTVHYAAGDRWLGLRLRPTNGRALWGTAMVDAENQVLRGSGAVALFPQLATLDADCMTMDAFADAVGSMEVPEVDPRISRAMDVLHMSGGRIKIEKLADIVGCTARQLNRLFRWHTGLGAKTHAQLVQFHRSLGLVQRQRLPITAAALEGGYADHAHLTRAFRRFGGFAPSAIPAALSLPTLFA